MVRLPGFNALSRPLFALMMILNLCASQAALAQQGAQDEKSDPRLKSPFKCKDSGSLQARDAKGKTLGVCQLQHTDVTAKISGFVSRVRVKQTFHNPFTKRIEAVYTFPLSHTGAVDDMVLKVGKRTVHATIKRREEARAIYEEARSEGRIASLLEQERPNIFTQSVANIDPGESIEVTLQYVEMLPFENGKYTFAFPTVVGPRFNPPNPTATAAAHLNETSEIKPASVTLPGMMPLRPAVLNNPTRTESTSIVPDAGRLNAPVVPPGYRSGNDISISIDLDSGVPNHDIQALVHDVKVQTLNDHFSHIELTRQNEIPNRDFVLSWNVCDGAIRSGCMAHKDGKCGYFSLVLMPPKKMATPDVVPKEMIFVIDTSGSQWGEPIQKAKETMNYILDHMNPQDTFQVVRFDNETGKLFDRPQMATQSMRAQARKFIDALEGDGGTMIGPAIEKVCSMPSDPGRLRIVTFMTDGYAGNDMEILGLIRKLRGKSRWFSFGTGSSVNRFLIDGMAREGGGEAEYVLLNTPGAEVGKRFYNRISTPVLANVEVKVEGVDAKDIFPRQISDVWAQKPLYISGRYGHAGRARVSLSGYAGGKPYRQEMNIPFPDRETGNTAVPSMWARSAVDALMSEDWFRAQVGNPTPQIQKAIVDIALAHHIMTQYTSFVAVDTVSKPSPADWLKVDVPVELPEGVSYEKLFGSDGTVSTGALTTAARAPQPEFILSMSTCSVHGALSNTHANPYANPYSTGVVNSNPSDPRDSNPVDAEDTRSRYYLRMKNARTFAPSNPVNYMSSSGTSGQTDIAATQNSTRTSTFGPGGTNSGQLTTHGLPASDTQSQIIDRASNPQTSGPAFTRPVLSFAPTLQGATNGTLCPQGANVIFLPGINTAGTTRVDNVSPFEQLLTFICKLLELAIIAVGVVAILRGALHLMTDHRQSAYRSVFWGLSWLALGYFFSPALILVLIIEGWKRFRRKGDSNKATSSPSA